MIPPALTRWCAVLMTYGLLSACAPEPAAPSRDSAQGTEQPVSKIAVDSAEARAIKARAEIADCPAPGAKPNQLPSLTLPCLGGGSAVDLARLEGPVVVNLFQSTCAPCRKELPLLAAYAERQDRVAVLGIDTLDTFPEAALALAQETGVRYPLLADPEGALDDVPGLGPLPGFPMTFVIKTDGSIGGVKAGEFLSEQQLADWVEEQVGDPQ